ncbi:MULTISPECIES: hypothetical protein [unclassified Chryseobacterium]|uniref:hypothetical protein n=1 Tax=unclassified Chryseobacterium TaxID=2593645 RepID=UPI001040B898|nr:MULTISPECIES: hypothetical protein [unclassified Chryseobacterium]
MTKYEDSVQASYSTSEKLIENTKLKSNALKKRFDFIKVQTVKNPASIDAVVDSLELEYNKAILNKVPDSILGFYKIEDSLSKLAFQRKYYEIPRPLIIKTGKIGRKIGILYVLKHSFNPAYYLKISNDEGKTWKNYFTGLYKESNFVFKSNSNFLLWKDENHFQIEADIVRMTEPLSLPGGGPVYETVKNNALVVINLKEILKDSDEDGWNDLDEIMNYFTNPFSKDSDRDGISDSEDLNPKYATVENDFTKIFEAIIYGNYTLLETEKAWEDAFEVDIENFKNDIKKQQEELNKQSSTRPKDFVDKLRVRIIVTDDENLLRINTYGEKVVFLTSKEYQEFQKTSPFNILVQRYSKMFKCLDLKDTYILEFDEVAYGKTYLIKKSKKGYIVTVVGGWET